jgi:hypothetical protein
MGKNTPVSGGFGNKKTFSRTRFSSLDDTFNYAGNAGEVVTVRGDETGLTSQVLAIIDDHKVATSGTDTTPGYLVAKLEAGIAAQISESGTNPNKKARISVALGSLSDQAAAGDDTRFRKISISSTDTDQNYLNDKIETAGLISITATGLTQTIQNVGGSEKLKLSINAVNPTIDLDVMLNAPRVAPKSLGLNEVSNTYIDGTPGDASMRTLGTLTNQAAAGSDTRFTKVKITASDTTPNYLQSKLAAGTGISITKENAGADEDLKIAVTNIAIVDYLGSVGSQAAMLLLVGNQGDWCTRSDLGTNWILSGTDPTILANWTQWSYPPISFGSPVASAPGDTGTDGVAGTSSRSDHKHARESFGTTAGSVCQGNDSRLSDSRTPTAHATNHLQGGSDAFALNGTGSPPSAAGLPDGTLFFKYVP